MPRDASALAPPTSPRPTVPSLRLPALPAWRAEHLVVLGPLLIVPGIGTAADWLRLAVLVGLLVGVDALTNGRSPGRPTGRRAALAALVPVGLWLATVPVLGAGPAIALGLYLAVAGVRRAAGPAPWPLQLVLVALGTAVAVDLALVTLGLERDSVWLGLGAAIGTAVAAARVLAAGNDGDDAAIGARALLEVALVAAVVLVLGLYGALLTQQPVLRGLAGLSGPLGVAVLALALLRLTLVALAEARPQGVDRLGLALLAGWALFTAPLLQP